MGINEKNVLKTEKHNRLRLKKSLVSKNFIKKGEKFKMEMFGIKRPATGLPPKELYNISKFIASKNVKANSTLKSNMIRKVKKWKY